MQLNPIIRGWANYHRHAVSKRIFVQVDNQIHQKLWQWARRRHPRKTAGWVSRKYYSTVGNNKWVFNGEVDRGEERKTVRLLDAQDTPIKRHVKIKSKANPYSLEWETYFERRIDVQMEANLQGYKKLLRLWLEQRGICPICDEKITRVDGLAQPSHRLSHSRRNGR